MSFSERSIWRDSFCKDLGKRKDNDFKNTPVK